MSSVVGTSSPTFSLSEYPDVREPFSLGNLSLLQALSLPTCPLLTVSLFPSVYILLLLFMCLFSSTTTTSTPSIWFCVLPVKRSVFHFSFCFKGFLSICLCLFLFFPFCFYSLTVHNLKQCIFS